MRALRVIIFQYARLESLNDKIGAPRKYDFTVTSNHNILSNRLTGYSLTTLRSAVGFEKKDTVGV